MFLHLIESSRHRAWYSGPTLWSAGAHVALAASFIVAAGPAGVTDDGTRPTEVIYFLPLLPEKDERPKAERLEYSGDVPGRGEAPREDDGAVAIVPVGGGTQGNRTGTEAMPLIVSEPSDSGDVASSPVYLEAELDQPVERDPSSAGPLYPNELRAKNVEGQVVAEWIVDTTGRADSSSFRIVEATHPLFAGAVREVLPAMNFRPAELMGQRVRQLVRQQFRFVIERPVVSDSTPAAKGARRPG